MRACLVEGCERKYFSNGYCHLHNQRLRNGTDLLKPLGIKGENNPNWKGGICSYPNNYELKKMRRKVLKEENYTCRYCGKFTRQTHHIDLSTDNHKRENLTACCGSCNQKRSKKYRSKYRKLFGYTLKELNTMSFLKRFPNLRKDFYLSPTCHVSDSAQILNPEPGSSIESFCIKNADAHRINSENDPKPDQGMDGGASRKTV